MGGYILVVAQGLFAVALAPCLVGMIRWIKARLQNRRGASWLQPYRDLRKLLAKDVIVSPNASWVFHAVPFIVFGSTATVAFLIPLIAVPLPSEPVGDLLVVVYLLLLGAFFLALGGLDPGSAFGGMGASREMTIAAITEPTLAVSVFALAVTAQSTNLGHIVERTLATPATTLGPGHLLAFSALFILTLAETGRLPVDNPATHLELTMIHEAMVLEYSGRYLALIEWASALKLLVFLALLANLFLPWDIATTLTAPAVAAAVLAFVLKLFVLGTLILWLALDWRPDQPNARIGAIGRPPKVGPQPVVPGR